VTDTTETTARGSSSWRWWPFSRSRARRTTLGVREPWLETIWTDGPGGIRRRLTYLVQPPGWTEQQVEQWWLNQQRAPQPPRRNP